MKRYERFCTQDTEFLPISEDEEVVDNAYKHYLQDGEKPREGELVRIGPRDGKYVMRDEQKRLQFSKLEINDARNGSGNVKIAPGEGRNAEKLKDILYNSYINISLTDSEGRSIAAVALQPEPEDNLVILDNIASLRGVDGAREALLHALDYCKVMGYRHVMFSPQWGENFSEEEIKLISSFPHISSDGIRGFDWTGFISLTPPDEFQTEAFKKDPVALFRVHPNQVRDLYQVNDYLDTDWRQDYVFYELPDGFLAKNKSTLFGEMQKVRGIDTRDPVVAHRENKIYFDDSDGYQGLPYTLLGKMLYKKGKNTLDLSLSTALVVAAVRDFEEYTGSTNRSPDPDTIPSEQTDAANWILTLTGAKEDKRGFFRRFAQADDKSRYITELMWGRYGYLFDYNEESKEKLYNALRGEQLDENFNQLPRRSNYTWNTLPEMKKIIINYQDVRETTPITFNGQQGPDTYSFGDMFPVNLSRIYYSNKTMDINSPLLNLISKNQMTYRIYTGKEFDTNPDVKDKILFIGGDFESLSRPDQEKRIYATIGKKYWEKMNDIPHQISSDIFAAFKNEEEFSEAFALYAVMKGRENIGGESFENQQQFAALDNLLTYTSGSPPTRKIRAYLPTSKAEDLLKFVIEESNARFSKESIQRMADEDHKYLASLQPMYDEIMVKLERKCKLEDLMEQGKISEEEYLNSKDLKEFNEIVEKYLSLMKEETLSVERKRFKKDVFQKIAGPDGINQNFNPQRIVSFETCETIPDELIDYTKAGDYNSINVTLTREATEEFEVWAKTHLQTQLMADIKIHVGIASEGKRSFCKDGGNGDQWIALSLSAVNRQSTLAHEFGHAIEHTKRSIYLAAQKFLNARTFGEEVKPLGDGYKPDEVCKKDHFPSPYCGKVYAQSTEIISMGLQYMHDSPDTFAKDDPEYFMFMVDVLMGNIS